MRYLVLLVFLGGCARTVPLYPGLTQAQVKWRDAYARCEGQATADCDAVRRQFAIEDAYERQERTAAMQQDENQDARDRRRRFADSMQRERDRQAYIQANQQRQLRANCTTTYYGGQAQTVCN